EHELQSCALELGSDVPALLAGAPVRVGGRGEQVQPVRVPALHVAVAVAGFSDTAATYAHLAAAEIRSEGRVDAAIAMLQQGGVDDSRLGSALEPAARRAAAQLGVAFDRLRALTPGRRWHLTGSGGALFSVAHDARDAARLAAAARDGGFASRACRTVGAAGT
ncbi:MAG TPA: hypothetical protein VJU79_05075, partial [Candidatus Dormibacteraeota bacterium]|nr:hypothetical protein [Candidatus Dormibacteraeota bacterium]